MENSTIKNIFDFLEINEGKKTPFVWKLINHEPLTDEELIVKGNLDLANLKITSLPEGLEVGAELDLYNCKSLTSLPEGLKVGRNLYLENCTSLTSLPYGLEVGGGLNLENCTSLTSLPKGLKVRGWLDIKHTQLKNYTDDELREMVEPGFINGEIIR